MLHFRQRVRALVPLVAALLMLLALVAAGPARAATIPAAAPTQYNSTPDCPVSFSQPVCVWNVPVDPGNVFTALDYGQCPYWAAEKYPALVLDEIASDPLGDSWNGGTWLEHAQQEGLSDSETPAPGDLAVWQVSSADPSGHVAYVEAVISGGIIVSQMDGDSAGAFPPLQGSTELLTQFALVTFEQNSGLVFVQTGGAVSTPVSYIEAPTLRAPSHPTRRPRARHRRRRAVHKHRRTRAVHKHRRTPAVHE